jgi:hypothetical protein
MAATVVLAETNGPVAGSTETLDIANVNFGSNDSAEIVPATYPITAAADGHSYEKWLRLYVSLLGGSTQLDNVKVWLSSLGGGWKTGEGISTNMRTSGYTAKTYPTAGPVETNSPDADQVMPETEPASANLGIGGSLAGTITSVPSYTDWCVLQLDVTAATPAGGVNQKTLTYQWDEQ